MTCLGFESTTHDLPWITSWIKCDVLATNEFISWISFILKNAENDYKVNFWIRVLSKILILEIKQYW